MKVAVYSGSFNPLHIGHLAIMKYMVEEASYDMVYLIVSPKNPLKDGISSDSGMDRYKAAVEAVKRHFYDTEGQTGKVLVDDIELTMPEPHYTIRTLKSLKQREPGNKFTFIMGADSLADIRRWKDYQSLLSEFGTAVFPRKGHDLKKIRQDLLEENPAYLIDTLDAEMVDMSSTQIREHLSRGEDISAMLM